MFTGIDLIVLILVILMVFYLNSPESKGVEFKVEPGTILAIGILALIALYVF